MSTMKQARHAQQGLNNIYTATSHTGAIGGGVIGGGLTGIQAQVLNPAYAHANVTTVPNLTTISLSNLQGLNIESLMNTHHSVKKYEVYESPEDLMVLSAALHRHNNMVKDPSMRIHKLLGGEVFSKVTNEDREKAQAIKDYYSKKIMFLKLKDSSPLSKYRQDLNTFIHSDGLMFKEDMIGLAYHLPAFYEYDVNLDYVRSCVDPHQNFSKLDEDRKPQRMRLEVDLQPIKKIHKKRKRLETMQYWFKDDNLNAACLIDLMTKNPLEHIWNHLFDNEKVLKIEGMYHRRRTDDFEYFKITDWKFIQT